MGGKTEKSRKKQHFAGLSLLNAIAVVRSHPMPFTHSGKIVALFISLVVDEQTCLQSVF